MNRTLLFDSPFLLGFEHTRNLIERVSKAAEGYPPYNVEDAGDGRVRITLAVAGFTADQLSITLEGNQLTVAGKRESEPAASGERAYLHRGIAARGFVRVFILADGLEVEGARLEHGLLDINVFRPEPQRIARAIPIKTAG